MKKFGILLTAVVAALCLFGCGSDTPAAAVSIDGAKDWYVKAGGGLTDAMLLEGVTVAFDDDTTAVPTLDKGGADYDKPGRYAISYVYGELTQKQTLYVFGLPVVRLEGEALTDGQTVNMAYDAAKSSYDFTRGVTAEDTFGETLEVTVTGESDGYDGRYGQYEVTYEATDRAGNVASITVTYAVSGEADPVVGDGVFDFSETELTLACDLSGAPRGLLFNDGELVGVQYYALDDHAITIDGAYLAGLGVGEYPFKLDTPLGFKDFTVTVTDAKAPIFGIDGLKNRVYEAGKDIVLPAVSRTSNYQTYELSYALTDGKGGAYAAAEQDGGIALTGENGQPLAAGTYTLAVTGVKADGASTTRTTTVEVLTPAEYALIVATGKSDQFIDRLTYDPTKTSLRYVDLDEETYGVSGAFEHTITEANTTEQNRLEIALPYLETVPWKTYATLTFDVYFTALDVSENQWGELAWMYDFYNNAYTHYGTIKKADGTAVTDWKSFTTGVWYTCTVDLSKAGDSSRIMLYTAGENCAYNAYYSDFRFAYRSFVETGYDNYVFAAGAEGLLPDFGVSRGLLDYSLTDPNGESVTVSDGKFTPQVTGVYTLSAAMHDGSGRHADTVLTVVEQVEYALIVATGKSNQFIDRLTYDPTKTSLRYVDLEEETYGVSGAFEHTITKANTTEQNRLAIALPYLETVPWKTYATLTFDVYFTAIDMSENASGQMAWMYDFYNDVYIRYDTVKKEDGTPVAGNNSFTTGVWYTCKVDLSKAGSGDRIMLYSAGANCTYTAYYSDFRFAYRSFVETGYDNYVFAAGAEGLLPDFGLPRGLLAYSLTDPNGESVTVSDGKFTPQVTGAYALTATVLDGSGRSAGTALTVVEQAEYALIVATGKSNQFIDRLTYDPTKTSLRYVDLDEETYGVPGAFEHTITKANTTEQNRLAIALPYLETVPWKTYATLTFDVYFTAIDVSQNAYGEMAWMYNFYNNVYVHYDTVKKEDGTAVTDWKSFTTGVWYTCKVDLSRVSDGDRIMLYTAGENCTYNAYYSNFRFA